MGPCTASSCCCQVQSVSWVPVRPPIAAVSIATLCHVPLSGLLTLLVVSNFCHRVLYGLHCCCLHRHTVAPHSGFGPVTAQMSEVCGVILRSTALICIVILTVSIISLPRSRLQGHLN
ncbi:unnamed protein product [Staurois parvus]|uniref:Uncharacterized protein n=1 Tax=Staurois parvus TaxID=386267 RepID=A0ABN9FWV1_9NEOB|nr:unnamed protein product [Staurois parvus]